MAIDERSRHELFLRLEDSLGPEAANTMMEHLPPVGWADVATKRDLDLHAAATKRDLEVTRQEISAEFKAFRQEVAAEFASVRQETAAEFRSVRQDMAAEFKGVRQEMETMRHDIVGTMRAEFMAQSRTMFLAIVTIVLTMAGLTFGLVVTLVP